MIFNPVIGHIDKISFKTPQNLKIRGWIENKHCYSTQKSSAIRIFQGVFPIELAVLMRRLPYIPKIILGFKYFMKG